MNDEREAEQELAHSIIDKMPPDQLVSLLAEMDDVEAEMRERYRGCKRRT